MCDRSSRWLALALLLWGARAVAQPRIDPGIASEITIPRPMETPGVAAALVELESAADAARLDALPGVSVARAGNRPVVWRSYVVAQLTAEGLAAIDTAPFVRAARLAPRPGIPPLDRSGEHLGLAWARGISVDGVYGAGTLVADLDTPLDVFHPAFFHADAGYYDWIDRNGNGFFDEGDAVDLSRDGTADPGEIASELLASPVDFGGASSAEMRPRASFDPGIDWIFIDVDADGVRDVGLAEGYDDTAPGLGEPIFVPDDVDRDGMLEPSERVVQLGSSKVRAMRVDSRTGATLFERGATLSMARRDYTGGSYGYADTLHGSGVVGIMLADVPLIGRRWVGIAPEAEVVLSSDPGETNLDGLMWALTYRPDVMVHEYVLWTTVALDGSDPQSMLIDASAAEGVAHACPSGNIGGSSKHAFARVAPGTPRTFGVQVDSYYVELTVNVPVGSDVTLDLIEPSGARHPFTTAMSVLADGTELWRSEASDVRSFRSLTYTAYRMDAFLPAGPWQLVVSAGPGTPGPIDTHVFAYDENGFSGGTTLTTDVTDDSTMAWPSTADRCIAVGAVPSHERRDGPWFRGSEAAGTIRSYSGRGPRLDGAATIGVSAPDNPLSPLGAGDVLPSSPGSLIANEGAYQVFGGTSGAGPHVAGALLLLAERGVRGIAALDRVRATAVSDGATGPTPNAMHGSGRLDVAAALGVTRSGRAPTLRLVTRVEGGQVVIEPNIADDVGDTVVVRWDVDYDGEWDTALEAPGARSFPVPFHVKVEAQDDRGLRDQATFRALTLDEPALDGGPGDDAGADAGPGAPGGSGCGCRVRPRSGGAPAMLLAAVALGLLRRRAP